MKPATRLPARRLIRRALLGQSLRDFIAGAWHVVEPAAEYKRNWHIDVMAEHLEAASKGELRRLVINVPPGSMKSLTCAVFWPAWRWTHSPETRWIFAAYSDTLARRDSLKTRRLVESEWYRALWGDVWTPNADEWGASKFSNSSAGFRMITSIGGSVTGEHGHVQVVDDPVKPIEVTGAASTRRAALERALTWWVETMSTRMVNAETSVRVIIMQRLHESDLAGAMLREGGWEHLNLPMEARRPCVVQVPHPCSLAEGTSRGFKDLRAEGEPLWPARFSKPAIDTMRKDLGPRGAAAQLDQRPMPPGGGLFKHEYLRYWTAVPRGAELIQSWDCAFKGLDDSDFVVGQVWARQAGSFYLVDQVRARMTIRGTLAAVLAFSAKWRGAVKKLIEDKANGPAVIDLLKSELGGLQPVDPQGGKEARANAVEPLWASGNVYLPDPRLASWVPGFVEELTNFPGGANDDQVDAMTQALVYLYGRGVSRYREAMQRAGKLGAIIVGGA